MSRSSGHEIPFLGPKAFYEEFGKQFPSKIDRVPVFTNTKTIVLVVDFGLSQMASAKGEQISKYGWETSLSTH